MIQDAELLKRYANRGDEASFAELLGRHLNHVYSTCLRLVGGDSHLAEDATQTVFSDLARKAGRLSDCGFLTSWLHTSARFAAAKVARSEHRRRHREHTAVAMATTSFDLDPDWEQVRPVLDQTIGELDERDRVALLLRFFERKPFAQIGGELDLSENAARMRVERALDKLRSRLALRGITSTTSALTTALAQFTVGSTPPTLQEQILAGAATATPGVIFPIGHLATVGKFMLTVLVLTAVILGLILTRKAPPTSAIALTAETVLNPEPGAAMANARVGVAESNRAKTDNLAPQALVLSFLDAQTGLAITNEVIGLKGWVAGSQLMVEKSVRLEDSRCATPFEATPGRGYWISTHIESYADVRLHWSQGAVLPESYFVRLVRPTMIAGRVVDPFGRPVAGAEIGFNTENVAHNDLFTEDHCVDYLTVRTDRDGRWHINRLAPEMVGRIFGTASHPDLRNHYRRQWSFHFSEGASGNCSNFLPRILPTGEAWHA